MVSRSWRSQTQRTPAGETVSPRLRQFVGDPHLAEGRLLDGQLDDRRLDLLGDAVLQDRLPARDLLTAPISPPLSYSSLKR